MEFSWNPNPKCTEKPQSSISTHPFSNIPSFSKISNPQVRTKKLVNSAFYHLCPSGLASQGYIFLYFFKLFRVLSLQNACWIFSDLYIPTLWEKFFNLWCSHSKNVKKSLNAKHKNAFNLCIFTHAWVPHSKLFDWIFWRSAFPKTEGVEEAMICSNKIQSDKMNVTWSITLSAFSLSVVSFVNFLAH